MSDETNCPYCGGPCLPGEKCAHCGNQTQAPIEEYPRAYGADISALGRISGLSGCYSGYHLTGYAPHLFHANSYVPPVILYPPPLPVETMIDIADEIPDRPRFDRIRRFFRNLGRAEGDRA